MTGYFSVRNFEKFQHYKDRNPPWIRLYNSLLDSYEYACLPDVCKAHLLAIYLLASRSNNRIPADTAWLKSALHATEDVDLIPLINGDFIIPDQECSKSLASGKQSATQSQSITEDKKPSPDGEPPLTPSEFLDDAVEAWNALAHDCGLPKVERMNDGRRRALKVRMRECGGMDGWSAALTKIRGSPFLLGENPRRWCADFDFLLQPKSFTKLIEGGYDPRPGAITAKPTRDEQFAVLDRLGAAGSGPMESFGDPAGGIIIEHAGRGH